MKSCPFSKILRDSTLIELSKKISKKFFTKGQTIITEGETAKEMFLVLQGKVEIYVKNIKTATVGPKNAIGDLALETGNLRKATVKAKTDLFLLTVQGNDYNEILLDQKQ